MRHDRTEFGITIRNFSERTLHGVGFAVDSDVCRLARARPPALDSLHPGQMASVVFELERVPHEQPGVRPILIRTQHGSGDPMVEFELAINTDRGSTPEDRGLVAVGRVAVRPAPAPWRGVGYFAVPLLLVGAWLVHSLRRRQR